ncbi:glycoside hydrolase [Mesorhizobium sp. NBSH29]|uniref:glycoside hydrolase family 25 protein n=1 Tax=Mesorhizobium sp. NBSH29 TaxID=2654249 RepID=UPI001896A1CF|nr:GH25 family lysozyme [Mesorhizobium sp. NBSH29]QPC88233.1 glycoside hydrolase [Mesorhizobium sp. NBSH29]
MRRVAAFVLLSLLGACTSVDDLAPVSSRTDVTVSTRGIVAYPRFNDNDPHDWTNEKPWRYAVHGTDVSKYQTSVDWSKARASGISFAFIKATEGGDRVDDLFDTHWRGTRAAGIPRAAYHFYYFCRPASEQAAWFIANVPRERGSLPPVLDMEWNPESPSCKLRPPPATVRSEMATFLRIVEKHYGKKPVIYTSVDFFADNELSTFTGYEYWLRSVAGHPTTRYGSHPFSFWQYTGTGVVPGIKGNADINVFNGSQTAWQKWLKTNTL